MKIVSVNVGLVETHTYGGRATPTAGHKRPVPAARLGWAGVEGDAQADRQNHGGPDKAVCVYAFDHYPFWEQVLGAKLEPGAFSENLTITGLREAEVCLGDTFRAGEALVQISQPRVPCYKLAGKHRRRDLAAIIHATSFSGFYLRVLDDGLARAGDGFDPVARHPAGVTVEFANQVMYGQRGDEASLRSVLGVQALSAAWRVRLEERLEILLAQ